MHTLHNNEKNFNLIRTDTKGLEIKSGHRASAQTAVWGYTCPANRELMYNYGSLPLALLTSVMYGPFPETDASNPTYIIYHLTTRHGDP